MSQSIRSLQEFIGRVSANGHDRTSEYFYRGHSNKAEFKLNPKLFRNDGYKENEDRLFRELIVLNPHDFVADVSTTEKLVRMQHHSLPTRLLDITSNPLMALYFACKPDSDDEKPSQIEGEVIILKFWQGDIKFFDSDTASCIANLAKLNFEYKQEINLSLPRKNFNKTHPIPMLIHFIKEEKPYFQSIIDPKDLGSVICVRTKFNNSRIASQSGAFLLFGLHSTLEEVGSDRIRVDRITVDAGAKDEILQDLDTLNINESTVFPYIENSAKYIATKYERRA